METGKQQASAADAAWERHGRMAKVIGALTVVLFIVSFVVDSALAMPILFGAMGFFVLAAWHVVLYQKGKRERAAA